MNKVEHYFPYTIFDDIHYDYSMPDDLCQYIATNEPHWQTNYLTLEDDPYYDYTMQDFLDILQDD